MSHLVKPARWAWNRDLLTPAGKRLARGLTLLVPFWDQADGDFNASHGKSLVGDHAINNIVGATHTYQIAQSGMAAGSSAAGENRYEYPNLDTLKLPGNSASAFLYVNDQNDSTDTGYMGLAGSVKQMWWRDATNKMTIRINNTNYSGATGSMPGYDGFRALGFSFNYGSQNRVAGYVDGAIVVNATATKAIGSDSNRSFCLGGGDASRGNNNIYSIAAVWDRYLTQEEQELLARDPFILLRRDWSIPTVLSEPVQDTSTVPVHNNIHKPARWAWNPNLLTPAGKRLARGLTFLVPFWDQADGDVALSQLRDLVNGEQPSSFTGTPTWEIAAPGIVSGVLSEGTNAIAYSGFKGMTGGGSEASAFMYVNENNHTIDNGYMGIPGANFLWWHDGPNRMSVRHSAISYPGTADAFVLDSEWHALGFSFAYGTAWNNVAGYVDGVSVLDATPTAGITTSAAEFRIGSDSATRNVANQYGIAAVWDRYLTQEEQELLARDPFILLRRDWSIPTVLSADTGQTITPTLTTQTLTAADPTITTGNVNLAPSLVTQLLAGVDPTVSGVAGNYITPTLVSSQLVAIDPALIADQFIIPNLTSQALSALTPSLEAATYILTMEEYQAPLNLERGSIPWRLHRFYGGNPKEYSVFIVGGVATPLPGKVGYTIADVEAADVGSGYNGRAAFIGGYVWDEITEAEKAILEAAGYTITDGW